MEENIETDLKSIDYGGEDLGVGIGFGVENKNLAEGGSKIHDRRIKPGAGSETRNVTDAGRGGPVNHDRRSVMETCLESRNVPDAGRGGPVGEEPMLIKPGTLLEEIKRRATFDKYNWPVRNPNIHPDSLAEAGFFYEGKGDTVRCQYCNMTLCKWEPDDDPMMEHKKWYPYCPFVNMY